MKKYEKPVLEVAVFTSEDFITVSGGGGLKVDSGKLSVGENTINF